MNSAKDRHGMKPAGSRPLLGPAITGLAGLIGGLVTGTLGGWAAVSIVGPFELGHPDDLFGNALRALVPIMVFAAGAVGGFLIGTVIFPMVVMLGLSWERVGRTIGLLLLLLLGVAPLTIWLLVQIGNRVDSMGMDPAQSTWLLGIAAIVVGGLTPAVARRLAMRGHEDS